MGDLNDVINLPIPLNFLIYLILVLIIVSALEICSED